MHGQHIGYVRVSTFDQHPDRQLEHVHVDRLFTDKASGKDTRRPALDALLSFVRDGDTVVVHSMDRLARNLDDLRRLVQTLTRRGVRITFVKEHLTFTGEDSPMAHLMLSVMGAFAEFERALLHERQRRGLHWPGNAGHTADAKSRCPPPRSPRCANALQLAATKRTSRGSSASVGRPCTSTSGHKTVRELLTRPDNDPIHPRASPNHNAGVSAWGAAHRILFSDSPKKLAGQAPQDRVG